MAVALTAGDGTHHQKQGRAKRQRRAADAKTDHHDADHHDAQQDDPHPILPTPVGADRHPADDGADVCHGQDATQRRFAARPRQNIGRVQNHRSADQEVDQRNLQHHPEQRAHRPQ
ncbi:MAG: hypothetical protein IPK19_21695 [Chloroflexi bacterium]|nr:hypothetical protein [Chloroflexota bacterium]